MKVALFIILALTMTTTSCQKGDDGAMLSKGETLLFFGDSITQAGDEKPDGYINLVRQDLAQKHADLAVNVIGAGIGGHKVPDLLARLDRDVLAHNPDVVVIYIGINDVWHWFKFDPKGTEKDVFESGLNELIDKMEAKKIKTVLCTPSVIGEKTDGSQESDEMLKEYANISRGVTFERGLSPCDLNKAFNDHLKVYNPENQESGILTSDGVHLNAGGDRFVADFMMATLGL